MEAHSGARSYQARYASVTQLAGMLGLSPWTIRRRVADGTFEAVRIGGVVRIPLDQNFGTPVTSH